MAAAATPDGRGYWLVTRTAGSWPSATPASTARSGRRSTTRSSASRRPRTAGLLDRLQLGKVFHFGDAGYYGSAGATSAAQAVVAMAATPDGGGYWLAEGERQRRPLRRRGASRRLAGESQVAGGRTSPSPRTAPGTGWPQRRHGPELRARAVGHGSLTGVPPQLARHLDRRHAGRRRPPPLQYPSGLVRLRHQLAPVQRTDVARARWRCPGRPLIPPGRPTTPSPSSESTDGPSARRTLPAARRSAGPKAAKGTDGAPYDLYMFLNSPPPSDTIDQQGPTGSCDSFSGAKQSACLAYNYGYNSAQGAVAYAATRRAPPRRCGGSTSRTTSAASTGRATRRSTR